MKSNTLNLLFAAAAAATVALTIGTRTAGSILPAIPVAVGYVTVAILVALLVLDYRAGPKHYASR